MSDPKPQVVNLQAGRHAICCCGKTGNAPFCDGSHAGTDFRPVLKDVGESGETIAWCTCRTTGNTPFCDGSHKSLWGQAPSGDSPATDES